MVDENIEISLGEVKDYARALHCPTRWRIIRFLNEREASTKEIKKHLDEVCHTTGKQNLYYHLSELNSAGIIEVEGYREEGGGAPVKIWKLVVEKITINLLKGEIEEGCGDRTNKDGKRRPKEKGAGEGRKPD